MSEDKPAPDEDVARDAAAPDVEAVPAGAEHVPVTEDPAVMAKANVWFIDTEPPELCANLTQKHIIHRYEFAGDKLAKSTNIETCGIPRASSFK